MPTVTFTAPTATVTTGTPAVTWTHTLGGGDSQTKYRVIVYTKAQTLSTTFNPGSTAGVWDSGLVSSAATSVTVGTVLTNTTTYVVYVQITETGTVVSSWTSKAFKVAFAARDAVVHGDAVDRGQRSPAGRPQRHGNGSEPDVGAVATLDQRHDMDNTPDRYRRPTAG